MSMRILIMLTYYRPHTSGLTIYAERMARALARRGHEVTVLTSHFRRELPYETMVDGVRVVRVPVLFRISKGVIMPTLGFHAWRWVLWSDVVSLHLPQFDAAGVAVRGRWLRRPTVLTYHCDLKLPMGPFNGIVNRTVDLMNLIAGMAAHRVVAYTQDFADHSPYLRRFVEKLTIIPPPVEMPPAPPEAVDAFRKRYNPHGRRPVIGMAARFAAEKGVEVLLDALPTILARYPQAQVWFAGQHEHVVGEKAYARRLMPIIRRYEAEGHWRFFGVLTPQEMAAFYPNLDLLTVPSLNSTESFGLVQVEAMLCGTPCVASDLPGVRQPVLQTGMGEIAPVGDAQGLAEAILRVLAARERYWRQREVIAARFSSEKTAEAYERLFEAMMAVHRAKD